MVYMHVIGEYCISLEPGSIGMKINRVVGRQLVRGPELGSIKISNSMFSAWNIYVINGRIYFLTIYDKVWKRRGNTKYIIWCLPNELSQVLVQYLVYVSPFAQALPLD
jgi:hypothetical protein